MKYRLPLFFWLVFLVTLTKTYSQQGKLINNLSKKGYELIFCETHELLKRRIDTTKELQKKVVYSKIGNVFYGVIYQNKYYHGDSFFHENIKTEKLYWYNIDYLDITDEQISYDTYVKNIYSCYNVDFKNNIINFYNVFYMFKNESQEIIFSSFGNDTITNSGLLVNKGVTLPNFNDINSIKNYYVDFDSMEYEKKIIGKPKKIENYAPLIFYYFVCLLDNCPTKCLEKDFINDVF
jgi:hypothetical protein